MINVSSTAGKLWNFLMVLVVLYFVELVVFLTGSEFNKIVHTA
jgi:hypothetical protein